MRRLIGSRLQMVVKCNPSKSSRFVAGYLVTSCFTLVAVNLLLILLWKRARNWLVRVVVGESRNPLLEWWLMHVCVCTCKYQKWVTALGQLQGIFNWQLRVVCVCVRERQRKRMWGTSASLYCRSLPHFSLLSLLYHPFFLPLFPSCNIPLHLYIFSGGIWFRHGQLGLRSSHNDWRIVHLQPQGGGPHLPGLPRWHWVCFKGAKLL